MADEVNCFHVKHRLSSAIICVFCSILAIVALITVFAYPYGINFIYNVGGSNLQIQVITAAFCSIIFLANCILAIAVIKEESGFCLIWVIIMCIMWKLHFILFLCTLSFGIIDKRNGIEVNYIGLSCVCLLQVLWLVFIILVGRHWYDHADHSYSTQNVTTMRRFNNTYFANSIRTINRSLCSTRMPQLLRRIES